MKTEQKQSKQLLRAACGVALMMALSLALVSQRTPLALAQDEPPAVERDDGDRDEGPEMKPDERPRDRFEERRHSRRERWEGRRDGDERDKGRWEHHRGGRLGKYLGFVSSYISSVQDPYQATGLALMGIKEYYRKNGKPADALPQYEALLKSAKDQKMRNILLFAIRQVYEETKDSEKLLAINKQILSENVK